jgi:hypothetical protein
MGAVEDDSASIPIMTVKSFSAGEHEFGINWNWTRNGTPGMDSDIIAFPGVSILRTKMLSKFTWMMDDNAVLVDTDDLTESAFSVDIESGGTHIVIGFNTSVNMYTSGAKFLIYRNGVPITTDWPQNFEIDPQNINPKGSNPTAAGTAGDGDTDNDTMPFSLIWVDKSPPPGNLTYTIYYRRSTLGVAASTDCIFNCKDNGADGYRGTMFAFEWKFATLNY